MNVKSAIVLLLMLLIPQPVLCDVSDYSETEAKILICLDGVPFSVISSLKKEGYFADFKEPVQLISTFPAITEIMLTEFFKTEKPLGYGIRYYDKGSNELKGGIADADAISIWFSLYDYVTPMIDRGIVYLWARWANIDIDKTSRILNRFDSGVIMLHLDSTDALFHNNKASVGTAWLKRFDRMISEFIRKRNKQNRPVQILLFSDHGNDMTPCKRINLEDELTKSGFNVGEIIVGETGIGVLPSGLISISYLYTSTKESTAIAAAGIEGVDFAVYKNESGVKIVSKRGNALIEKDTFGRFRYTAENGDPLELIDLISKLENDSKLINGFADEEIWFQHTIEHKYPNPLSRAWDGVNGHVENTADLLLSLEKGWHCGSKYLDMIVNFQGTHGAMIKESVTGFTMSNFMELKPARAEWLLDEINWRDSIIENARKKGIVLKR